MFTPLSTEDGADGRQREGQQGTKKEPQSAAVPVSAVIGVLLGRLDRVVLQWRSEVSVSDLGLSGLELASLEQSPFTTKFLLADNRKGLSGSRQ